MAFRRCTFDEYASVNNEAKRIADFYCYDGSVYFSATKKGNAIDIHIAATKEGKRKTREALNAFVEMLFKDYNWCEMVLGTIRHDRPRVKNLAKKCGFVHLGDTIPKGYSVYARLR